MMLVVRKHLVHLSVNSAGAPECEFRTVFPEMVRYLWPGHKSTRLIALLFLF